MTEFDHPENLVVATGTVSHPPTEREVPDAAPSSSSTSRLPSTARAGRASPSPGTTHPLATVPLSRATSASWSWVRCAGASSASAVGRRAAPSSWCRVSFRADDAQRSNVLLADVEQQLSRVVGSRDP